MGIFRRRPEAAREQGERRALTRETMPAAFFPETEAGRAVPVRESLAISDVFACVSAIARAGMMCPLIPYVRTARGRERMTGETARLLEAPAPAVTQPAFVAQALAHLALWNEVLIGKYRAAGRVVQLGVISPDRVQIRILADGEPEFRFTDMRGVQQILSRRDVIHARALSLDGVRGCSPIRTVREALRLSAALEQAASAFVANGSSPRGLFSMPDSPGAEETLENLIENWSNRHQGAGNAGRVGAVLGELTFTPVSMSLHDSEFMEMRREATATVCRILNVPPWVVGHTAGTDSLTYSNVETQYTHFVRQTLAPLFRALEAAVSADEELFIPEAEYAEFLVEGLLRADSTSRAAFYREGLAGGWLTVEEIRERESLGPLPERVHEDRAEVMAGA